MERTIAESYQTCSRSWPNGKTMVTFYIGEKLYTAEAVYEPMVDTNDQFNGDHLLRLKIKEL